MGAIDIGKRQTTRKKHVDVGLRAADYPTIQDYVGEAVMDTNARRIFTYCVTRGAAGGGVMDTNACPIFPYSGAQAMDSETDNNTKTLAPGEFARANFLHW